MSKNYVAQPFLSTELPFGSNVNAYIPWNGGPGKLVVDGATFNGGAVINAQAFVRRDDMSATWPLLPAITANGAFDFISGPGYIYISVTCLSDPGDSISNLYVAIASLSPD